MRRLNPRLRTSRGGGFGARFAGVCLAAVGTVSAVPWGAGASTTVTGSVKRPTGSSSPGTAAPDGNLTLKPRRVADGGLDSRRLGALVRVLGRLAVPRLQVPGARSVHGGSRASPLSC